ncbi:MAG: FtsX-like permease family protein [Acidobacteria bacterium]|nr:FtsX-like permease family protein [Acidobacteriota bacterium]
MSAMVSLLERLARVLLPDDGFREAMLGDLSERHGSESGHLGRFAATRRHCARLVSVVLALWFQRLRPSRQPATGLGFSRSAASRPPQRPRVRRRRLLLDQFLQDLSFARRAFARRPGTTLLALVVLALGIGAAVSMFSVLDAVILRPLPYPDADRLVSIHPTIPDWRGRPSLDSMWNRGKWEYEEFGEWLSRQSSFENAALVEDVSATFIGRGPAERIQVGLAGRGLFTLLGATPHRGRFFAPDDEHREPVGQRITLDGEPHSVIGVLPPRFEVSGFAGDVWIPVFDNRPGGRFPGNVGDNRHVFRALGKLAPGVTTAMASEETGRLLLAIGGSDHFTSHGAQVLPRLLDETQDVRAPMLLLMGAVLLLLLVACANVATFLLGQAIERRHEIAVRSAMGASGGRIVRQLLTEGAVLGLVGGFAGLAAARIGVAGLRLLAPEGLPRLDAASLDLRAAAFSVGVSLLAGLVFGLAPALSLGRSRPARTLRGVRSGSASNRLQAGMVVAEIAVATVLLVGAGLLTRSFLALESVDTGFRAEGVVVLELGLDYGAYVNNEGRFDSEAMRARIGEILAAVQTLPVVESAALSEALPFAGFSPANNIDPEGVVSIEDDTLVAHRRLVTPGYLEVMGIPLLEGRALRPADNRPDAAPVVVVNETLASRLWPNESALGKRLSWWGQDSIIVGVVAPVLHSGLDQQPEMKYYAPQARADQAGGAILAQTTGPPGEVLPAIRALARVVAPELPITRLSPLSELVSGSLDDARFRTRLISGFAMLAAVLSAMGLYGVTSRAVANRAREIGIRVALGAESSRVVALVLRDGLRFALIGAAVGVPLAVFGTRLLQGLLYEVEPSDPLTLTLIVALVAAIGTLATLVPSLRAARTDPVEVLKAD